MHVTYRRSLLAAFVYTMGVPKRCVEFVILVAAMVTSGGALIAAIFTEIKYKDLFPIVRFNIEQVSNFLGQNELFLKTEATAGLVFATTGVAVAVGILALIGRICNSHHQPSNRKIFFFLYLLYIGVSSLGFATAGILGAFSTKDWFDVRSSRLLVVGGIQIENLRNSLAATTACSLVTAVLYALLEITVIFCCSASRQY